MSRNGGYNAYGYVSQNPVNSVDPSGYFSNDVIANSLGVSNFGEVIQMFRAKWGLLKLLQEAESGDTLSLLGVDLFGISERRPVGNLDQTGCTIMVGHHNLRSWFEHSFSQPGDDLVWRPSVQAYYLNDQPFRDDHRTTLPDFALVSINFDVWAPEIIAGVGVGGGAAYIVDRYGYPYFSLVPFSGGFGGGSPVSLWYYEGYVNQMPWDGGWPVGDSDVPSEDELAELIPGLGLGLSGNAVVLAGSVEINLDETWNDYWVGTAGIGGMVAAFSIDFSVTFERLSKRYSVNPDGWSWVEELPRYEEQDIRR